MTSKVPVVTADYTIAKTSSYITKNLKSFTTIDYIYVVDSGKKLLGVFSIKELYKHPSDKKIQTFYKKTPYCVHADDSQEAVAYIALQHGIKSVPVVGDKKEFLGVVPHDGITSILHQELREDILQLSGIHRSHSGMDNVLDISIFQALRHRILWLILGLGGGLLVAAIISSFEQTLERNLILASFIPLVVYISDAVRTQLEAFTIRDFALFRSLNIKRYFIKQLFIVIVLAVVLGALLFATSYALHVNLSLSLVLGSAVVIATISSLFSGLLIPFSLRKLGYDPANASGPIGTIIQDTMTVLIYFGIATWML